MNNAFFITGTDTDVGKTIVTAALLQALSTNHYRVTGMKPIASGAEYKSNRLINKDAEILLQFSDPKFTYQEINPYCFSKATSPHIAAKDSCNEINTLHLSSQLNTLKKQVDIVLVEGAGGWFTPISEHQLLSDWVRYENLPIILVVDIKLGCINHALLTQFAIQQAGLLLIGWVANHRSSKPFSDEDLYKQTLKNRIHAPLLADLPFLADVSSQAKNIAQLASCVDITALTNQL